MEVVEIIDRYWTYRVWILYNSCFNSWGTQGNSGKLVETWGNSGKLGEPWGNLPSSHKTSYSTFKVEDVEFSWMWNEAFCQMMVEERVVQSNEEVEEEDQDNGLHLPSSHKTNYSTFKVEDIEFSWMWNKAFCPMMVEITRNSGQLDEIQELKEFGGNLGQLEEPWVSPKKLKNFTPQSLS